MKAVGGQSFPVSVSTSNDALQLSRHRREVELRIDWYFCLLLLRGVYIVLYHIFPFLFLPSVVAPDQKLNLSRHF